MSLSANLLFISCLGLIACDRVELPVAIEIIVHISEAGECIANGGALRCEELSRYLQQQGISPTAAVLIAPAKRAKYEPVAAALNSLREAGYKRVGFAPVTKPPS